MLNQRSRAEHCHHGMHAQPERHTKSRIQSGGAAPRKRKRGEVGHIGSGRHLKNEYRQDEFEQFVAFHRVGSSAMIGCDHSSEARPWIGPTCPIDAGFKGLRLIGPNI